MKKIDKEKLHIVLSKLLRDEIDSVEYEVKKLQGGTVGEVYLITGIAQTLDNSKLPYEVVLKTQEKWERHDDSKSWRREYDLYRSKLDRSFTDSFRWPKCYHLEMNDLQNEVHIWMEYIDGLTGLQLTEDMYEFAAYQLGKFQGRIYVEETDVFDADSNLSDIDFLEKYYRQYKSQDILYKYIRSESKDIPQHLCDMLITIDDKSDMIINNIKKLPKVFCHRDFWVANVFFQEEEIIVIDWDTAGWGYMGEDIASLIADESALDILVSNYYRCLAGYVKGFSEYVDVSQIKDFYVWERIILLFGYRIVEWYLKAESFDEKEHQIETLQKIYEIKSS